MSMGAKIGAGRTAEIYAWNDRQIVKLFNADYPVDLIEREVRLARAASQAGVKTPAIGEQVVIDGRMGLIYDRVDGTPLADILRSRPWRVRAFGSAMAALHISLHTAPTQQMPWQRDKIRQRIQHRFDGDAQARLLNYLETLPDDDRLCHSDFHPENILLTESGPVIIDWMDGVQGNPLADVARTSLILTVGMPDNLTIFMRPIFTTLRRQLRQSYLAHYCRFSGVALADIERWLPVVAAVRMVENIPGEAEYLQTLIAPIIHQ